MRRLLILASLLACGGGTAAAQVSTGFYDFMPDSTVACTERSQSLVEVRPTEFASWESTCALTNAHPLPELNGATFYLAECGGEGTKWTLPLVLMQAHDGGLIVLRPGLATEYTRCP